MGRRIKLGDVFGLQTKRGYAHFQVTHYDKYMGDLVRVLQGYSQRSHEISNQRLCAEARYSAFLYFSPDLREGVVQKVGNYPIPATAQDFPKFRTPAVLNPKGPVRLWKIVDQHGESRARELTADEYRMPVYEGINVPVLKERLEHDWCPEVDHFSPSGWVEPQSNVATEPTAH
jgi:hypothetical protein